MNPRNVDWRFANSGASIEMNVDGSSTPVHFDYQAPATTNIRVYRCNITIVDGSVSPTKFGGATALTNGLLVQCVTDGEALLCDFLNGQSIKRNVDWVWLAGNDNPIAAAAGDDVIEIRWTIERGLGAPLALESGDRLRFTVQDDLTVLTEFRIMVQGRAA